VILKIYNNVEVGQFQRKWSLKNTNEFNFFAERQINLIILSFSKG